MSLKITNVHLPFDDPEEEKSLYTVICKDGRVNKVAKSGSDSLVREDDEGEIEVLDGEGGLLLPSLCHSHIHLDKCYILDKGDPLVTGDFHEALRVTSQVKSTFRANEADLYERGDRLVRESLEAGVTCMRAHVEVDATVGDACVRAALRLKEKWAGVCDVLICVFMQDPLFDNAEDKEAGENAKHLVDILSRFSSPSLGKQMFSAVGSAPYVERTHTQQVANITYILSLARQFDLHVDFHLDYDLSSLPPFPLSGDTKEPLIWSVLSQLQYLSAPSTQDRLNTNTVITIGHATRLTLFPPAQLHSLRSHIDALPYSIHFVGLPQSDMYMMGRHPSSLSPETSYDPPRGTMNVIKLSREFRLNAALAVNNVGNVFTPQGVPDPLALCPLGVAVYQDGTREGCRALIEAVTIASKRAIGINLTSDSKAPASLLPTPGSLADFVLLHDNKGLQDAALCPSYDRTTVKAGKVVAWRRSRRWNSLS